MEIPKPEKFDFNAEKWPTWKHRFLRFRLASNQANKSNAQLVNTLLYCLEERAEDMFASFSLNEANAKKFDVVTERFNQFFIVKKSVILKRAQFNRKKNKLPAKRQTTSLQRSSSSRKLVNTANYAINSYVIV